MALKLIIKGNAGQAIRAAHDHGVSLNRLGVNSDATETYAVCASDYHLMVATWFCEAPLQAPFPVGTLLHYHER